MLNYAKLLEGKNCIVTAGAHGLGYAVADLFASHGANVAICGLRESGAKSAEKLRKLHGTDCIFFQCDMGNMDSVAEFADKVLAHYGTVDVLVNNVGVNRKDRIVDLSLEDMEAVHNTNFKSAVVLMKKCLPKMMEQHSGSIVNVSSMNSLAPSPTTGSYASSKGAMNSLSKVMAVEGGKYGVRCNVICPGWIATTYMQQEVEEAGGDERVLENYNGSSPMIAPARASDIANHILFLASDMSSYVTGTVLRADGAAVIQAQECQFPEPDDAEEMRLAYYRDILDELKNKMGE
ncbi:MAG: SDR family oxidoreductase [Clostridia bacterium]|nr:SDR family oxidoreductase [Clostridia bacterium]